MQLQKSRSYYSGVLINPKFKFKNQINTMIVKTMTSGIVSRIQREVETYYAFDFNLIKKDARKEMTEFQVQFRHIYLIVLSYSCCFLLSLIIFLCELLIFKQSKRFS